MEVRGGGGGQWSRVGWGDKCAASFRDMEGLNV